MDVSPAFRRVSDEKGETDKAPVLLIQHCWHLEGLHSGAALGKNAKMTI